MIAVVLALAVTAAPPPRYLVSVGHNEGLPSEMDLRFAERDAVRFASVMQAYGGVAPERTRTLRGPSPSDIEHVLDAVNADVRRSGRRDAILLFYYSGHADENDLHLGGQRWSRVQLERKLSAWPGKLRIAVVDACRSYGGVADKGFSKVPRFSVELSDPVGLRGGVTLRSSSAGEASQESDQLEGAVYTHYLLTGLRGAADEDGDRRVTLEEAYLYAYQQSVRRSAASPGTVMHPSVQMDLRGAGALVLTETVERTSKLVLPAEAYALYLVYQQPSGRLLAEVRTASSRTTQVAVAPGKYLVQRRSGLNEGEGGARQLTVADGASVELAPSSFSPIPTDILAAKGGHLQIVGHELTLYGAGLLSYAGTAGPRARVGYAIVKGAWAGEVSLDIGRFSTTDTLNDRTEQWVGGDIRLSRRRLLGPVHLSLGGAWRVIDQSLERKDGDLLDAGGLDRDQQFVGLTAGPTLGAFGEWSISPRWFLRISSLATAFIRREGDDWRVRPEGSLELGLGLNL